MMMQAKICGISTPDALDAAIAGRASHVGFVFFGKSPRNIVMEQAAALAIRAAGRVRLVGLFVDPEANHVDAVRRQVPLDMIQLHGEESPAFVAQLGLASGLEVWKAIAIKTRDDLKAAEKFRGAANRILYDAKPVAGADLPGGTGMRFDWTLLEGHAHPLPWILAGGLDPANAGEAVRMTRADFVDVSSGVESKPGIKDVDKIAAFLKATSQL
ncbi:MAG: hypothetical protein RIS52_2350 [Pseudomonadota bacterium]